MSSWMRRRIERSRARCERPAPNEHTETRREPPPAEREPAKEIQAAGSAETSAPR
jgi:hypothetical protein